MIPRVLIARSSVEIGSAPPIPSRISASAAPGCEIMPYTKYKVVKPFEAEVGPAAAVPGFGAEGSARRYMPSTNVQWLIDNGFLEAMP